MEGGNNTPVRCWGW